jgi:hypothetical protein
MGVDPQKRLAKGNKTSNMEIRVWCELVKLHTVHKKKPNGWRVVDDDYGQAVGNPKRKV